MNSVTSLPINRRATDRPIQNLFLKLDEDIRKNSDGPNVKSLILKYVEENNDWKNYVNFNEIKYTRNLVNANENLELIILCWLPKHETPIHNHSGQHCWTVLLDGGMQETKFHFVNTHGPYGEGPLEEVETTLFKKNEVGYINDDIALHLLKPTEGNGGITLHLYSKPIDECNTYCKHTGTIVKKKLGFFTVSEEVKEIKVQKKEMLTNSISSLFLTPNLLSVTTQ